MAKRTLLIDADVVAYQCAAKLEHASEWAPGHWTWHVNFDHVCDAVDSTIIGIKEKLEADNVRICLTDPEHNFRKDVLPSYKMHRATVRRPLVLLHVKEWLVQEREGIVVPGLEGDDVMGILATRKTKAEQIIVSLDKDMKTIPGKYVRTRAVVNDEGVEVYGAWEIRDISEAEANHYFLTQALTGDVTDGYGGCPGVGPKKAEEIVLLEDTIAKNWERIVATYAKKGLGEEEALRQARCARILRASDYDLKKKEVILWTP